MSELNIQEEWVEYITLIVAFLGFFIAIMLRTPAFSYIAIALLGLLLGRTFYIKHFSEPIFPFAIMISAFFIGYFAGSFFVSRLTILLLFVATFVASYFLHREKIITIFKSKSFLK
ncbi:MAG: hypothetical protein ABIG93_01955 [archaeon]|nr:hypothetical protein [Nanoarchaeota archaeon]